ncbi:Rgp1 protein [Senna tora]|uniref:Rgp1 protein n=1 Tax=Senna tora TaxID=362788 RepID=A0A835CMY2_9FABA|nr:Rgp1 protein [Senna tora]
MLTSRFSLFGGVDSHVVDNSPKRQLLPILKIEADREVYRPGDPVIVTIEISNASSTCSFLVERLSFEIKGIEKLDTQWFATQKPLPGSKQRRGEHVFLDCSTTAMVSNQIVSAGTSKSYVVRTLLPGIIPPSYKGSTIRYLYYVKSTLTGEWLTLDNGQSRAESLKDVNNMEVRIPLQVWVNQKSSGLLMEEEIVPSTTVQMDIYWKEMDGDADWIRANDIFDGVEDGYDSSRDEISSVSSYNPMKENLHRSFGSSLSLRSSSARSLSRDLLEGGRTSLSSNMAPPRLSVAEVLHDSASDVLSPQKASSIVSPSQQQKFRKPFSAEDDAGVSSSPEVGAADSVSSEGFIRGRSYNIRLDDQVLLKFSPKNSDPTYYLSDMIGGTLTFFHEERARRCLEVSITLETSETISRRFVHHSRKNSPTITKVQSDHYEVVADLVQTSFLFSIPMDGPMSFSTPHVSVQWVLRFEFFTTPKNLDWTKYEHPLLIDRREKCEWVLPITVHAPPSRNPSGTRSEKSFSLDPMWAQN